MKKLRPLLFLLLSLTTCGPETQPGWVALPVPDEFGEDSGRVFLQVYGKDLSPGLTEAVITYAVFNDLISGGEKTIFTFTLNGQTSHENIMVITPDGQEEQFNCYDGIIFNIDSEARDVERLEKLMRYEKLTFRQGPHTFSISTNGFHPLP